jgi:ABC-type transport system involved in multi-copper enzyme maturation permease subunit
MNGHTAKALIQDAYYQVLDNKVFRLLVILSICLVAPTFLIAFTPTEVNVLFGWKTLRYDDISIFAGLTRSGTKDIHVLAIQGIQSAFVQGLAGSFGIMLSLAATAFFVPRMLEKGEADILFSKPTGRFVLLMARYSSGVLFVGVLAFLLVLGMHLGFLLRSGYSDPAFLWSVLTLVYVFALIHAFSTLVGVLTRSAIAALLAAILFFGFNGCIHALWINKEHGVARLRQEVETNDSADAQREIAELDAPLLGTLITFLDGVHFVLPKTADADYITNQLRRAVSKPEFVLTDPVGGVSFAIDPQGLVRAHPERVGDLASTPAIWTTPNDTGATARVIVSRRPRESEAATNGKSKPPRPSDTSTAREFLKSLEGRRDLEGRPDFRRDTAGRAVRAMVNWTEKRDGGLVHHVRAFYGSGDWMYEFDLEHKPSWKPQDEGQDAFREFLAGVKPQRESAAELESSEWYAKQLTWSAPLRFNAAFSILSSIAFALVMLLVARWRLSRIDF